MLPECQGVLRRKGSLALGCREVSIEQQAVLGTGHCIACILCTHPALSFGNGHNSKTSIGTVPGMFLDRLRFTWDGPSVGDWRVSGWPWDNPPSHWRWQGAEGSMEYGSSHTNWSYYTHCKCTLQTIHFTLQTAHCTLYTAHYKLLNLHSADSLVT